MIRRLAPKRHDEDGAYAIFFAIMVSMLLGVGALAVDLGNAYQRKAETQSQADLAALSAAPSLGNHTTAVAQVLKYLKHNTKAGQSGGLAALTTTDLTDGNLNNGEVQFPSQYFMKVTTPQALVNFGLANAMGKAGVNVYSTATVGVGTPGAPRTMPFYAVKASGCDYGTQSLTDPANGKSKTPAEMAGVTLASPLTNPTVVSNNAVLNSLTPYQFDTGVAGTITNIDGTHLQSVSVVGFYRNINETPSVATPAVETTSLTNSNNNSVSNVALPAAVYNTPGIWWVRVYANTNGGAKGWTTAANALPIRVGDGPIQCGNISSSGNFGTLKLPRSSATSSWAPDNMAVGLQPPLSLVPIDSSYTTEIPQCTPGDAGVTYSTTSGPGTGVANTDCVDTDTGLTALVTTQGLITGTGSGYPGRLVGSTSTSVSGRQCGPGHSSSSRVMLTTSLNDDTLSCYMTDPSAQLSTIASPTYSGGAALDPAIYDSPRFCYVPVVQVTPSSGGSNHYAIVEMRPCFITSEDNSSSYNSQKFNDNGTVSSTTTTNGLTIPNSKVTTMQVFLFNVKALPNSGGNVTPGTVIDPNGPLVSVLTN